MQLATDEQVEAATAFLRSLDIVEMLKKAAALRQPMPLPEATKPPENPAIPASLLGASSGEESITSVAPSTVQDYDPPPPPLIISLSGLESMHAPEKTSNLYTIPKDPTSRLSTFAISLRDAFTDANLLVPDKRPLLLHATVLNTLYAKSRGRTKATGHGKDKRGVEKLDATALLEEFREFEWAKDFRIEKISICQMGAKKEVVDGVVANEEYAEVASAQLP